MKDWRPIIAIALILIFTAVMVICTGNAVWGWALLLLILIDGN